MPTLADIARRLNSRFCNTLPRLVLLTDEARLPDPLPVVASLPRKSAVILRHYDDPDRESLARSLAGLCRRRGIRLLIGGDARLAFKVKADGLHLPEALARRGPGPWRFWRRKGWMVTAAAHSPAAIWRARKAFADAVLLSPVFSTLSHPDAHPLGCLRFALWRRTGKLPAYALGGVAAANASALTAAGCAGFAAIGEIIKEIKPA